MSARYLIEAEVPPPSPAAPARGTGPKYATSAVLELRREFVDQGKRYLVVTDKGAKFCASRKEAAENYANVPHLTFRVAELTGALYRANESDEDDLPLGAPDAADDPTAVTIRISGDGADRFRAFMQGLAGVCNAGSSREVGILDASDEEEKQLTWSFDGDGNTRIEVDED